MSRNTAALPNDNTTPPLDEGFSKHELTSVFAIKTLFAQHTAADGFANAAAIVTRALSMADEYVPALDRDRPAFPASTYAPHDGKGLTRHQFVAIQTAAGIVYGNTDASDFASNAAIVTRAKAVAEGILDADARNDPAFPTIVRTELAHMGMTKLEYAIGEISAGLLATNTTAAPTTSDAATATAATGLATAVFDALD